MRFEDQDNHKLKTIVKNAYTSLTAIDKSCYDVWWLQNQYESIIKAPELVNYTAIDDIQKMSYGNFLLIQFNPKDRNSQYVCRLSMYLPKNSRRPSNTMTQNASSILKDSNQKIVLESDLSIKSVLHVLTSRLMKKKAFSKFIFSLTTERATIS